MSLILIATILGVIGCLFVSRGEPLNANYVWSIGNLGMIYYNYTIVEYEMMIMFVVYEIIALYGVWNLRFKMK